MSKPNFVIIFPDMWRGDCLSIAGHPYVKTPYIDDIAQSGVYFDGAYSACPTCIPARVALATGLNSSHNGRLGYRDQVVWRYKDTLMQQLYNNGYHTIQVGKTHFYPQRLHLGFEENILYEIPVWHRNFESDYHRWLQKETNGSVKDVAREHDPNTFVVHPWNHAEYLHPTNWTTSQAIESLARRDPTRPFFLQVGYHRPHTPYDPPAAYWEKYKNLEMAPPPIGDWCGEYSGETHSLTMHHGDIGDAMRDDMRRGYYASVSHMDYEVGKLFYWLRKLGLLENTYVFVLSDHGDMLGDHYQHKKAVPFEGSARIPLLVYSPVLAEKGGGKRRHAPVSHMDIMPTILDLAGITPEYEMDGESLRESIDSDREADRTHLHGEHSNPELGNGFQYLVNSREKYIWETKSGKEYYFDLKKDPGELHNAVLDVQYEERVKTLRKMLITILEERPEDGLVSNSDLCPGKILGQVRSGLLMNMPEYP